jgi:hypothetical protein
LYTDTYNRFETSNWELWQKTKERPIKQQIKERKWHQTGHTLHKPQSAIERHTLYWNPQGTRKRGTPRTTWKRTTEWELQQAGKSWKGQKD